MNDWTCDLCGAFILAGFEQTHEQWHWQIRRGTHVTFSPAPTQLPQTAPPGQIGVYVSSNTPFDAGTLTNEKFRELFGLVPPAPEFKTVQDIEDYLNER